MTISPENTTKKNPSVTQMQKKKIGTFHYAILNLMFFSDLPSPQWKGTKKTKRLKIVFYHLIARNLSKTSQQQPYETIW